jgi:hypothetical protein
VFPVHAMEAFWGTDVRLHSLLTSELDGSECLNLCPANFNSGKEPGYLLNRRLFGA